MPATQTDSPGKLAPTVEAIDGWLAQANTTRTAKAGDPHYGVDIRTKAGSWRCITSSVMHNGERYYWTIRGEGSSNGCRETAIRASDIAQARRWYLPGY